MRVLYKGASGVAAAAVIAAIFAACAGPSIQDPASGVSVGESDLGGVVTSANGPEAGVWVIAETTDLPTRYAKVVVTDDRGRYVLPGLPKANYSVWVRGYGLVDSSKVQSAPGKILNLAATTAPSAAAAAEYYPGMYWYSLINIPGKDQFPGTGEKGQRHLDQHQDAGSVGGYGEKLVSILPRARLDGHAQGAGVLQERREELLRDVGEAHAGRTGDDQHGAHPRVHGRRQGVEGIRRLD
jgi:hypothetical protein